MPYIVGNKERLPYYQDKGYSFILQKGRMSMKGMNGSIKLLASTIIIFSMLTSLTFLGTCQATTLDDSPLFITGTVVDGNGDPISGARVTLETAMYVLTDDDGRFNISAAAGNHTLTITYSGAATKTVKVILSLESLDIGTVELLPQPVDNTLIYGSIVLAIVVAALLLFYIYWGGKKQDEEERKAKEKK